MDAIIISVGTELSSGLTLDTNGPWLARRLADCGVVTSRHVTVPDDVAAIRDAVVEAARSTDVVLVTGGLGPTLDDITREAVAAAADLPLVLDQSSLDNNLAFSRKLGRPMHESNKRQAYIPQGASVIRNTCGTAPGFRIKIGNAQVYVMPGVPREMKVMYESLAPELSPPETRSSVKMRTIHCFGASEASIAAQIEDLMEPGRQPSVGITAEEGTMTIRVTARGANSADATLATEADAGVIRDRLGKLVFGVEGQTLPEAVADLLVRQSASVSTAESCTGGMLAKMLTDVPGSSRYFHSGFVTYSDEAKRRILDVDGTLIEKHGAVSGDVAVAMAEGCLRALGTDYALSVTGIAGPGGGSVEKPVGLVFIAIAGDAGTDVRKCRFGDHWLRDSIRVLSCKTALNLLRLRLLG